MKKYYTSFVFLAVHLTLKVVFFYCKGFSSQTRLCHLYRDVNFNFTYIETLPEVLLISRRYLKFYLYRDVT